MPCAICGLLDHETSECTVPFGPPTVAQGFMDIEKLEKALDVRINVRLRSDRPTWYDVYMGFARTLSLRSTCARLQVGAVVTTADNQRVLAVGYNGNYRGGPNVCDSSDVGGCGCLHAEENAIIKLDPYEAPCVMYVTHSPCLMCAKRIINVGSIFGVVYSEQYRLTDGLDLLSKNGIKLDRVA